MRKATLLILSALLVSPLVFAIGGQTFSWTAPTEYEDATPLANSEIENYSIYCDGDTTTPLAVISNNPVRTESYIAPSGTFAIGDHVCTATATTTAVAGGEESQQSGPVNFTVVAGQPKPPIFALQ